ncbi:MAG: hypothetical protein JKY19_03125 [Alcanivoracaceae bacterium]|nr:hypothetical protein [Alcanivoracaceae bacterium]
MCCHNGNYYPALFIENKEQDISKLLENIVPEERDFSGIHKKIKKIENKLSHLWNGPTYVLRHIENKFLTRLTCSIGAYFDTLISSSELSVELMSAISQYADPPTIYKYMPIRQNIHASLRGSSAVAQAWSGNGRSAALSISCLLAIKNNNTYHGCFRRRSQKVAEDAGLYHVVPSMILQPEPGKSSNAKNFDIKNCILREVAEELFAVAEGDNSWKKHPAIKALNQLLDNGGAELTVTGFAMCLIDLRPEILALLMIHDQSWYTTYADTFDICTFEYEETTDKTLHNLNKTEVLGPSGLFSVENSVVAGAACIIAGMPHIEKQLQ